MLPILSKEKTLTVLPRFCTKRNRLVYLVETYGIEKFKRLYIESLVDERVLEKVYKKPLDNLEQEWITVIQKEEASQEDRIRVRWTDAISEGIAIYSELGYGPLEHGTYPAAAEEERCLLQKETEEGKETALLHADKFNEAMRAWKEAIETFKEALKQEDIQVKAEMFRKAFSLYEVAGDQKMMITSEKHAEAYESLAKVEDYVDQGTIKAAEDELSRAKTLLRELGEPEEYIQRVEQQIQAHKGRKKLELEVGIIIGVVAVVVVIFAVYRKR